MNETEPLPVRQMGQIQFVSAVLEKERNYYINGHPRHAAGSPFECPRQSRRSAWESSMDSSSARSPEQISLREGPGPENLFPSGAPPRGRLYSLKLWRSPPVRLRVAPKQVRVAKSDECDEIVMNAGSSRAATAAPEQAKIGRASC